MRPRWSGWAPPAPATPPRAPRRPARGAAHAPRGDVLRAEVGDELWAAFSMNDGHAIADPLRPSADAVLILGQRARQLHRAERRGSPSRRPRIVRFAH